MTKYICVYAESDNKSWGLSSEVTFAIMMQLV